MIYRNKDIQWWAGVGNNQLPKCFQVGMTGTTVRMLVCVQGDNIFIDWQ